MPKGTGLAAGGSGREEAADPPPPLITRRSSHPSQLPPPAAACLHPPQLIPHLAKQLAYWDGCAGQNERLQGSRPKSEDRTAVAVYSTVEST